MTALIAFVNKVEDWFAGIVREITDNSQLTKVFQHGCLRDCDWVALGFITYRSHHVKRGLCIGDEQGLATCSNNYTTDNSRNFMGIWVNLRRLVKESLEIDFFFDL